ncbi:putative ribonuclease H-like domain-containing protein [Tanacetum coccineum]
MTKNVTEHVEPKKKVWTLVDLPYGKRAIGTKWVYINKKDNRGIVVRTMSRLMDVKSAFLYGTIEEEVYVCQPSGFEDPEFPNKVYKVEKALYGLHQAPRAWYETLSTYLLENRFRRGTIDKTLFIKKDKDDILLVHVYVDDIIFGSTKKSLCTEFEQMMHKRFQMSSMGELTFFLGLQVKQKDDGIFISQDKYVADILKKFDFATIKIASTHVETNKALLKDEEVADVDVHLYRLMIGSLMYLTASRPDIMFVVCACVRFQVTPKTSHLHAVKRIFRYLKGHPKLVFGILEIHHLFLEAFSDSDYAGACLHRKSITGGYQFLGRRLISWQCKKQTIVANSTTEAEYVAATNCYRQNPVFHSKTNNIEIRHHFIKDSYKKRLIQVIKIHTDHNVADLLTKAFDMRLSLRSGKTKWKRAATTASSLEAEQDSGSGPRCQDTILGVQKLKFDLRLHLNKSYDPPLSRVNTLGSREDNMKLKELMEFCTKLSVRALEFWATTKAKSVNGERQIQALVDKKKVTITEKSVRSNLMLEDVKGIECLPNDVIFEQLTLMGAKTTAWNEFSSTMASVNLRYCYKQHNLNFFQVIFNHMMKNLEGEVLDLEEAKTAQAKEITSLKKRVKQLEKRKKSGNSGLKRLRNYSLPRATITIDELTLAQTLIEIKAAKPKAVTTSATTITTAIASTRPMAKGIVFHDQEEQASAFTPIKKDQIALDEELALRLHAKEQAELEKERVAQEEASRVENIEKLDSIQAMIEAGEQLAARLQAKEQE